MAGRKPRSVVATTVLAAAATLLAGCAAPVATPPSGIVASDFRAFPIIGAGTIVDLEGTITNHGPVPMILTDGSAPFGGTFQVSGTAGCSSPGVSPRTRMGPPLNIGRGEVVTFRRGDGYLSLTGVPTIPPAGSTFILTLDFDGFGSVAVPVNVQPSEHEQLPTTGSCG